MSFKIVAVSIAVLAFAGTAHAQMQPKSTPTGAAVPSAQQVTGKAADAHGRDQPQPNSNANSGADQGHGQHGAAPSPTAAPTK
jgi:hypothetical protein